MTVDMKPETMSFQTEVKQLLHLMIHSLYSNKEIFMRELISNASDALDKLRFKGLSDSSLYEQDSDLKIFIDFDKDKQTITIRDNGIGMNRDEIITNLGTIARSGTKEFLEKLSGEQTKDSRLIGQFGVGFYSSFIVADKVVVKSRRAGDASEEGIQWESKGEGEYTLEAIDKASRGTEIILHLKDDCKEFVDGWRLRNLISTYSDHISFPIQMKKTPEFKDGKEIPTDEIETVNKATALWVRNKNDITDEEYKEFYKQVCHDFQDPLVWTHNRVEGKTEYTSLFYVPSRAPFDLWNRERKSGIKLYVQRVFIMDDAEQFMPGYLRFIKGLIDCSDLPLNISREILQSNRLVETIKGASVKKILSLLENLAEDEEKYASFYEQFGEVLKEGPAEDYANREQIARLLRFASTHVDNQKPTVSLKAYIERMQEGQDKIYYITAENYAAAKSSPHLELFKEKGIEVLLLSDRVDEWLVSHLNEFDGKTLQSVAKGNVDIEKIAGKDVKEELEEADKCFKDLLERVKKELGEQIKEVRMTKRLTTSPACIVADENDMGMQMQRILKAAGQAMPESKPIFELNPDHEIVKNLDKEKDESRFVDWTHLLFDQAVLADGGQLSDPALFAKRLNKLFLQVIG